MAAENRAPPEGGDHRGLFAGGGEMGARMAAFDWAATPLGPVGAWPESLKTCVRVILTSRQPMFVWWGDALINLYNDAYKSIVGGKHPAALGQPASAVWREIWDQVGPRAESSMRFNEGTYDEALLLIMERHGYQEETYYTFSYSPVPNDRGGAGGILCANSDDTPRIIGGRQLALLRELAAGAAEARSCEEACARSAACLGTDPRDLPFALIYLLDPDGKRLRLAGASGVAPGHPAAPPSVEPGAASPWPFGEALAAPGARLVEGPAALFRELPAGAWPRPPRQAALLPVAPAGRAGRAGLLVVGLNPFRPYDDDYRGFLGLVAGQIASSMANAVAYEEERRRAEELAELDRAKTAFFSNVSHEFRTPLTLMLGPLDDALAGAAGALPAAERARLEVVRRNGLRLLKLVNTLLDFARIEAGRAEAVYEPTDLAALSAELASNFRSAVERAGMRLVVDCPPLPAPAYVDRDMWEKIVLNLLSNAFKHTFEGEIGVSLRPEGGGAVLEVRDTGVGIPPDELPHLFERFHRVRGARSRTHEGTGIGLALVHELVRLHGGSVAVESRVGAGTTFAVRIPSGRDHLPEARVGAGRSLAPTSTGADAYVQEALRWLPDEPPARPSGEAAAGPGGGAADGGHILLADDNADMREYVARLLREQWPVTAVADGAAALASARERPPALVLSDVMMPGLDGFQLLAALRGDERTRRVPVILLSARAGEEATAEGLRAGASDYLVKPFSSRELVARVAAQLTAARLRAEADEALRERDERLRLALEAARMVAWRWDPSRDRVEASELFAEMYGLPAVANVAEGMALVVPEDLARHRAVVERAAAEGAPYRSEFRIRRPDDGRVVWLEERARATLDAGGRVASVHGVVQDVTERKQAEERRERLHAVTLALSTALTPGEVAEVMQAHGLAALAADTSFAYLASPDGAELRLAGFQGPPGAEAVPPKALPAAGPTGSATALRERRPVFVESEGEYRARFPESARDFGSRLGTQAFAAVPLVVRGGEALGTMTFTFARPRRFSEDERAFLLNLGAQCAQALDRARAYERERRARADAEEASRLKDEFIATLSHELRTPLTAIVGWAAMLRGGAASDPALVRKAVATIERNAQAQRHIIDDLLDVSRIVTGKLKLEPEPVDLGALVADALDTVRHAAAAKQVELDLRDEGGPHRLVGDPERLRQVAWNLLSNAVRYTERGGRVTASLRRDGEAVELAVADTGRGIAPSFLPFVWERFRQADGSTTRSQGGLGLGLSIVREVVGLHGGTVEARSEGLGEGATFVVRLPAAAPARPSAPPKTGRPAAGPSSLPPGGPDAPLAGARVLVVDDDDDARALFDVVLGSAGADALAVASVDEALAALEGFRPDVLVTDIGMPGKDGYTLLRALRERGGWPGDLPAIAVTAYAGAEPAERARRAGFARHVAKPIDPAEFIAAVAEARRAPRR
ncbi:MAG TPA: ATP-binding protein [Polyangiaceae bacterium]|nr:ATP-binding protein [Polyangiaceae bacterium]